MALGFLVHQFFSEVEPCIPVHYTIPRTRKTFELACARQHLGRTTHTATPLHCRQEGLASSNEGWDGGGGGGGGGVVAVDRLTGMALQG